MDTGTPTDKTAMEPDNKCKRALNSTAQQLEGQPVNLGRFLQLLDQIYFHSNKLVELKTVG